MSDPDAELLLEEQTGHWAMSYGFTDADDLKQWGEQMERERLAKFDLKEVTENEQ